MNGLSSIQTKANLNTDYFIFNTSFTLTLKTNRYISILAIGLPTIPMVFLMGKIYR